MQLAEASKDIGLHKVSLAASKTAHIKLVLHGTNMTLGEDLTTISSSKKKVMGMKMATSMRHLLHLCRTI